MSSYSMLYHIQNTHTFLFHSSLPNQAPSFPFPPQHDATHVELPVKISLIYCTNVKGACKERQVPFKRMLN